MKNLTMAQATALAVSACLTAADLPVRSVVLYKNGVGYFERAGEVGAGQAVRLEFKADQMNDVLKSLTVLDKSGGKIVAVRYDSSEPLSAKLGEFPFKVEANASLAKFVDQVKGAKVELTTGAERLSGLVIGAREEAFEQSQGIVTILTDDGAVRTAKLTPSAVLKFADAGLQQRLKEYLLAIADSRSAEKRMLHIDSSDAKLRNLQASYLVAMPVWKSSYRLLFGAQDQTLEGWAIVDNTTGEDWYQVSLALVSGKPISFITELYQPKYRQRPVGELPEEGAQAPVLYDANIAAESPADRMQKLGIAMPRSGRAQANTQMSMGVAGMMAAEAVPAPAPMISSSIAPDAVGRDLGELFEYRMGAPVTVKKGESAMIPFLQQKLPVKKLLIYRDETTQYPQAAAELHNLTGKTLDGGAITVFDSSTYSGEALMETLKVGEKRIIGYAVDLGTRITTKLDTASDQIREIKASGGVVTVKRILQESKTYTIRNIDAREKTLRVEMPIREGFTVVSPKPSETTVRFHRFEVKLPAYDAAKPAEPVKLTVVQEMVSDDVISVSSIDGSTITSYAKSGKLSAAGKQQLDAIAAKQRELTELQRQESANEAQIRRLFEDQIRLRENIRSLNNVAGQQDQVQRYSQTLAKQEVQLATLRDQQAEWRTRQERLRAEVSDLMQKLQF